MPRVNLNPPSWTKSARRIGAVEKYVHENNHGVNNLAQKVDALGTRITRDIAAVEGRIEGRIKAMDGRLAALPALAQADIGRRPT